MTRERDQADFSGLVLMSVVAALDGSPWVTKGHLRELSSEVAAVAVERMSETDSFFLPDGTLFEKRDSDLDALDEYRGLTDLTDFLNRTLNNLVHPGDENTKPFPILLPGLRTVSVPPELAGHFAEEAGLPHLDTPKLVAEALAAAITQNYVILTREEHEQLRQQAADAPTGHRVINIRTTPTGQPVLSITIDKASNDVVVPAKALQKAAEQ
ncbi:hypothetical protein FDG57_gp099 [Mycobacterium phage Mutaforma13]|uniref:Uncharacterized protein n=1 Tax=Mycobacterium phage Mutaforma13 TaxID=2922219 RepID=G1DUI7_9CAUD|nr:hypothetical protein FDG57_gp099 [Mycobacterium phage Mutaforma13]AEJ93172.1 hypothetical protein MUTAFORMA13_99 [Mycobacterium phage Mutaforma13]